VDGRHPLRSRQKLERACAAVGRALPGDVERGRDDAPQQERRNSRFEEALPLLLYRDMSHSLDLFF